MVDPAIRCRPARVESIRRALADRAAETRSELIAVVAAVRREDFISFRRTEPWLLGDRIDGAGNRAFAVQHRSRPFQHFDALEIEGVLRTHDHRRGADL